MEKQTEKECRAIHNNKSTDDACRAQAEKYVIGLDYGTLSARAVIVGVHDGEVVSESVYEYPHGVLRTVPGTEEELPSDYALQEIDDYVEAMYETIRRAVEQSGCKAEDIIGIGIDATSSTFLPLTESGKPLCKTERFKRNPHAQLKLWKHHGAQAEAERITELANRRKENFMMRCGGRVNAEWMLPKLLEIAGKAPDLYEATDNFIEVSDYLVYLLTGEVTRCMCHAGYKLLWNEEDGYPSEDFLWALHPPLVSLKEKLKGRQVQVGECVGKLTRRTG